MPDVGEGLTEAEIVTWRVAVGDTVAVNQMLVEIETAKAAVELPSPFAGTVGALLAQPGDTVRGRDADHRDRRRPSRAAERPLRRRRLGLARPDGRGAKIGEAGADGRIATLVGYGPRPGGRAPPAPPAGPRRRRVASVRRARSAAAAG